MKHFGFLSGLCCAVFSFRGVSSRERVSLRGNLNYVFLGGTATVAGIIDAGTIFFSNYSGNFVACLSSRYTLIAACFSPAESYGGKYKLRDDDEAFFDLRKEEDERERERRQKIWSLKLTAERRS